MSRPRATRVTDREPASVTITPGTPRAFITRAGQGINFHRNTWHGVLTPLHVPGLFAVIDRIGDGANLQEFTYENGFMVTNQQE